MGHTSFFGKMRHISRNVAEKDSCIEDVELQKRNNLQNAILKMIAEDSAMLFLLTWT